MVRHGMGMRSEPGMLHSPLYVLECDSSPWIVGFVIGKQVSSCFEPCCCSKLQQFLCHYIPPILVT